MAAGGGRAPGHPGRGSQWRGGRGGRPAPRAHRRFRGPAFPEPVRGARRPLPNGAPMQIDPAVTDEFLEILATVAAVPVTPFGPDGAPDWDCHARLIGRLVENGITLVTPNGNTGEFYTLTPEETGPPPSPPSRRPGPRGGPGRRGPRHPHRGRLGDPRPRGRGPDGHGPPAGHPYLSADGWVDYHVAIAEAVPDLGVVLYIRDPQISGRHIRRLGKQCPNVVGVKYAVRDMVRFAAVARDAGLDRFAWLAGLAELTAPGCWATGRAASPPGWSTWPRGSRSTCWRRCSPATTRPPCGSGPMPGLRGAARRGFVRRQRQRGQGGPRPARPGPPRRPPAEPAAARRAR